MRYYLQLLYIRDHLNVVILVNKARQSGIRQIEADIRTRV